jgi:hypothetical protein
LRAAREGRWNGGKAPYGYAVRGGRLVPGDPAEVAVLRELFARYAAGRDSLRELARDLNRRGVPSPCGCRWHYNVIRKILRSRLYLGELVWNRRHEGRYFGVAAGEVTAEARAGRHHNPASDHVVCPGSHEPLVGRETFELVAQRLEEARRLTAPSKADPFALSGLVVCSQCGSPMHGVTSRSRGKVYKHYLCSRYNERGRDGCTHNRVLEAPLVACVLRKLRQDCQRPDNLARLRTLLAKQAAGPEAAARAEDVRRRLADLEGKIARGRERYLTAPDELTEDLKTTLVEWAGQRERLRQELDGLECRRAEALAGVEAKVARALELLDRLEEVAVRAAPALVRAVLREMVVKVECSFRQEQRKHYLRSHFLRGVIHLRPDLEVTRVDTRALAWTP